MLCSACMRRLDLIILAFLAAVFVIGLVTASVAGLRRRNPWPGFSVTFFLPPEIAIVVVGPIHLPRFWTGILFLISSFVPLVVLLLRPHGPGHRERLLGRGRELRATQPTQQSPARPRYEPKPERPRK